MSSGTKRCRICGEGFEVLPNDPEAIHNPRFCQPESLRDRFAMAALTGLLPLDHDLTFEGEAMRAYKCADAMLAARKASP